METNNQKNDQNIIPNDADKQQKGVNVPNLRFSQFVGNWIKVNIKDILKILYGKDYKDQGAGNIPVYGTGGIMCYINNYLCNWNCVCIGRKGTINKPIYIDQPFWCVDTLFYSKAKNDNSPKFQYYLFQTINWDKLNEASGVPSLSSSTIENIKIFIPNTDEQKRIADFLSLIDQRIDTQSKIIEDLELFEKEINNTIINKLVEYKDLVKFSSIYNFAKEGGTPNTSHPEYYTKGSIPFVKIDDLTTKYLVCNQSFITKLGLENSSAWLIPANSILYSNGATIGAISINKYPVTTKQGILGIVPKSDYLSEYLYYFLRSNYFKKEICKITTQGTMKSAYIKDIDNILVPRINKNQQNEILTLLSEITLKIQQEKDILELYKKQKAYLLKNMFI